MTNGSAPGAQLEIRSEARGPHWIAWLASDAAGKPLNAVVLVGETKEEAEANAREYARRLAPSGGA